MDGKDYSGIVHANKTTKSSQVLMSVKTGLKGGNPFNNGKRRRLTVLEVAKNQGNQQNRHL